MEFFYQFLVFMFLGITSTYEADLSVVPFENNVVLSSRNNLPTSTTLSCEVRNVPSNERLILEWVVQNGAGTNIIPAFIFENGYLHLVVEPFDGTTSLVINELSYQHSGNYTCRAKTINVLSTFVFATISLSLELELEVFPNVLMVNNETQSIEMRCEMSQYIEPDENLLWFINNQEIISDSNKYDNRFEGGNSPSVMNGAPVPSRISILVVLDFQPQNDTGCYYCMTVSTQRSASAHVSTDEPDPTNCQESNSNENTPTPTPTPIVTSTPSTSPTTTPDDNESGGQDEGSLPTMLIIIIIACFVGLIIMLSAIILIIMCCICCWRSNSKGSLSSDDAIATINVSIADNFPPPLPLGPRPNLNRVSQTSDYYENEGEAPEKPYHSIPPYLKMDSLQLNTLISHSSNNVYDTISDDDSTSNADEEYIIIPNDQLRNQEAHVEVNDDKLSNHHEYVNGPGVEVSEERMSNADSLDEYIQMASSSVHEAENEAVSSGKCQEFISTTLDKPNNTPVQCTTYDRLASQ